MHYRDHDPHFLFDANHPKALLNHIGERRKGVVFKETVVLRRWGSSIQKFGFINRVDNVNWPPYRDNKLKADVSSVSPSSERISLIGERRVFSPLRPPCNPVQKFN